MKRDGEDRRAMLAARAEEAAGLGSWELDLDTGELLWSENMYRLLGLEIGEVEPSLEYIYEHVHVDDLDGLRAFVSEFGDRDDHAPHEYRYVLESGDVRCLRATVSVTERREARATRAIGSVQDVTDWRHAEREVKAHIAIPRALIGWTTLAECGGLLLAELARPFDALAGVIWIPRNGSLEPSVIWMSKLLDGSAGAFREATERTRLPRGSGLPGRAWEQHRPLSRRETDAVDYHRRAPVTRLDLKGALAIPVYGTDVSMVIELLARERVVMTESLDLTLRAIGHGFGQFMLRRGAEIEPRWITPRELEVLQLAAGGLTGPQIADHLVVSPSTVKSHFENIYPKLDVNDRVAAVAAALRLGIID